MDPANATKFYASAATQSRVRHISAAFLETFVTECYGVLATAIEDQNAFAPTLCFFPLIDGQTRVIRLQVIEGPNARDQVALDSYIKSHQP